jgi:cytochrome c biogenesis protein CcdA/glutaredoxin
MAQSRDEPAARRRRGTLAHIGRRLVFIVAATFTIVSAVLPALDVRAAPSPSDQVEIVLFWGDGCPHCETEREFLEELRSDYPDLVVRDYEVWGNAANLQLFVETAAAAGVDARAVPTTFIGDRVWVGFSNATADEIRAVVDASTLGEEIVPSESRLIDVPILGEIDVGGRSLLLSSLIIGFVDGVNPCSLWVLSILLALVLHSGSRRRVAVVGAVFLTVTSAMYGLYIVGAYSALSYAQFLPWIQRSVALVAIVLGLLQLKDGFGVAVGPSLGVSEHARPAMYQRMRGLAVADQPITALLGATVALAVGVSLLETPCTLGLPILWTNLLAENDVAFAGAAVLFVAYLSMFLLDELVVFVAVVATMRSLKVQERHGRALKIVSGMLMITLAAVMLVRPEAMETVTGTLAVFATAAALSLAAMAAQQLLTGRTTRLDEHVH